MASTVHVSLIGCVALRSTPLCVCVSIFTMKVLCVLSSWPGSLRSAGLWAEPGRRAMLPFSSTLTGARASSEERPLTSGRAQAPCSPSPSPWLEPARPQKSGRFWPGPSIVLPFSFTPTQACASSEERRLTSGWAQAPRGVWTSSSAENTEAPGWDAWGVSASRGPFLARLLPSLCPSADARRAPDKVPGPGANSSRGRERPAAAGCGDFCRCRVSCRLRQRAPGPRSEKRRQQIPGAADKRCQETEVLWGVRCALGIPSLCKMASFSTMVSTSEENVRVLKAW